MYGLPELNGDKLPGAALVANPGCYATSSFWLWRRCWRRTSSIARRESFPIRNPVFPARARTTARTHFVSVADNLSAYVGFGHRHVGEILEQLELDSSELIFTPHLLPIPRGILSTIYVHLKQEMKAAEVESCFRDFYTGQAVGCAFSRRPKLPQIQFSLHTNYCDLGFCLAQDGRRLVLVSCMDNLLKGAAGQAVQNMNLMYGLKEQDGLQ